MAKDDLKLKDLFTHLVDWIKGKFSEQDTKIAANKYTLPQATESEFGGVMIRKEYTGIDEPEPDPAQPLGPQDPEVDADNKKNIVPTLQYVEAYVGGRILDNQNSVLYSQYKGTAAGVSHVDNVVKSFEVGMNAQLNLKQDKIKIVTTEPTASSTASDPEGTIYFKV